MGGGCVPGAVPWVPVGCALGTSWMCPGCAPARPVIYERRGRCRGIVVATLWDLWDRGTYFEGPGDFLPPVATTFMGPGGILKFLYQQWYNGGYFCQAAPARHQCPNNTSLLKGGCFSKNFSQLFKNYDFMHEYAGYASEAGTP